MRFVSADWRDLFALASFGPSVLGAFITSMYAQGRSSANVDNRAETIAQWDPR